MRTSLFLCVLCITSLATWLPAAEYRGLGTHTLEIYEQVEVDQVLQLAVQANVNVLHLSVYREGMGKWDSELVPPWKREPPTLDVLEAFVSGAPESLDLVALLHIGDMPDPADSHEHHAVDINPLCVNYHWGKMDAAGYHAQWLDFADPEARQFFVDMVTEINGNYELDGLNLDHIRDPSGAKRAAPVSPQSTALYESLFSPLLYRAPQDTLFPTYGMYQNVFRLTLQGAQVLSDFIAADMDSIPAILHNTCGDGEVLLFNWNPRDYLVCDDLFGGDFHAVLKNCLDDWAPDTVVNILDCRMEGEAVNHLRAMEKSLEWAGLDNLYKWPSAILLELPMDNAAACPLCLGLDVELVERLYDWVHDGGRALVVGLPLEALLDLDPAGQDLFRELIGADFDPQVLQDTVLVHHPHFLPGGEPHPWIPTGPPDSIPCDSAVVLMDRWKQVEMRLIGDFVELMEGVLHGGWPDRLLSASVFRSLEDAGNALQDWSSWIPYPLDYANPMAMTRDDDEFASLCTLYVDLGFPCEYRLNPGVLAVDRTAEEAMAQIAIAREMGIQGHWLYQIDALVEPGYVEALTDPATGVYPEWVEPQYPEALGPPVLNVQLVDQGTLRLSWETVPCALDYSVYSSPSPYEDFILLAGSVEELYYEVTIAGQQAGFYRVTVNFE